MKRVLSLLLLAAMLLPLTLTTSPQSAAADELRGVWIATVYSIDFPTAKNNVTAQKTELDNIVNTAAKAGLNSLFFQVRPYGDALYKSSIFPWSSELTGTQGKDPGFDPLAYVIEAAAKKGIGVHAWINPYRLTIGSVSAPKHDINALAANHPVRKNPAMAVAFDDGKLYLNPGDPAARQLVLDGVKELIENYNLAGIHFDDYFYPSPSVTKNGTTYKAKFNDDAAYAQYGGGMSLADWRRSNTYKMISDTYNLIKSYNNKNLRFGVSPSGIWDNKKDNSLGSDTNGFSSYSQIYADTRKWVKDGIVDYIVPQIYWQIGAKNSDYATLVKWWSEVSKGTNVDLYIGHPAYRIEDWKSSDYVMEQLKFNKDYAQVKGSVFYGYSAIKDNTYSFADKLSEFYGRNGTTTPPTTPPIATAKKSIAPPADKLIISSPNNGSTTTDSKSYIIGTGIKGVPIYVNGQEVERTENGHFAMFVDLKTGENVFNFEHNGVKTRYVIKKGSTNSSGSSGDYDDGGSSGGAGSGGSGGGGTVTIKDVSGQSLVATVKSDFTDVRTSNSSSASRKTPLSKGFQDQVMKESPTYYQLRFGGWVLKSSVTVTTKTMPINAISQVKANRSDKTTTVRWKMPYGAPYTIREMVEGIEITIHNTQGKESFTMASANPMFQSISYKQSGSDAVYTLLTKKERYLFGYNVRYQNGYMEMEFKHPLMLAAGDKPLAGKTIHLDSGHGGSDPGASGPMGSFGPREYDLNMHVMLQLKSRLEGLGANIVTSNTDAGKTTSQSARENSVRSSGADLGISIHHNSVSTNVNVANVSGTETLYTQPLSRRLAMTIQENLIAATGNKDRGPKQQNLYMCRHYQMPTVLIEMGFVTNPYEYDRLTDKAYIAKQVDGIVEGILDYMRY